MFDLLGKSKLESRIGELEKRISELEIRISDLKSERDDLQQKLNKRDLKMRRLSSEYQEARLNLKNAEQSLAALSERAAMEPTFKEVSTSEGPGKEGRAHLEKFRWLEKRDLTSSQVDVLLMRLQTLSSPSLELVTAYIHDPAAFRSGASLAGVDEEVARKILEMADEIGSERGVAIFCYPELFWVALVPPLPLKENNLTSGTTFEVAQIKDMLDTPLLIVSAHAGETLIGVSMGRDGFSAHEVVESLVKEKHSKGGFSQRRFERLRDEDIRRHYEKVIERIPGLIEDYRYLVKYAVLSGDPNLVKPIGSAIDLPVIERRIERFEKKNVDGILDQVYGCRYYRA